jgi:hypothetical protein
VLQARKGQPLEKPLAGMASTELEEELTTLRQEKTKLRLENKNIIAIPFTHFQTVFPKLTELSGTTSRRIRMKRTIASRLRKILGVRCLEDYTVAQRRAMWPEVQPLQEKHLCNCRVLVNREEMLSYMPRNGTCAEIGILHCDLSQTILQRTQPKKLHLVDIDEAAVRIAREKFPAEISSGEVEVHLGDSGDVISSMQANYFDWIYIDGDHSYSGAKRDLEAARATLKPSGFIAVNDYIFFSPSGLNKYGVIEAVNEFCIAYDFELLFLAFQGRMYNDVVLRKI